MGRSTADRRRRMDRLTRAVVRPEVPEWRADVRTLADVPFGGLVAAYIAVMLQPVEGQEDVAAAHCAALKAAVLSEHREDPSAAPVAILGAVLDHEREAGAGHDHEFWSVVGATPAEVHSRRLALLRGDGRS